MSSSIIGLLCKPGSGLDAESVAKSLRQSGRFPSDIGTTKSIFSCKSLFISYIASSEGAPKLPDACPGSTQRRLRWSYSQNSRQWSFEAVMMGSQDEAYRIPNAAIETCVSWDEPTETLCLYSQTLARRRLFYIDLQSLVIFSDSLSDLICATPNQRKLDALSGLSFMTRGLPGFGRTLFRGVRCVEPGYRAVFPTSSRRAVERLAWPTFPGDGRIGDGADPCEFILEQLQEGLESPYLPRETGLLLSGGVDSSLLAALLSRRDGAAISSAMTVYFAGAENPDLPYARMVAAATGIPLDEVTVNARTAREAMKVTATLAEPPSAMAALTHACVASRAYEKGLRSAFSGLGSDEIFGGYSSYMNAWNLFSDYCREQGGLSETDALERLCWDSDGAAESLFSGIAIFMDKHQARRWIHPELRSMSDGRRGVQFLGEYLQSGGQPSLIQYMFAHECQHRIPAILFTSFEPVAQAYGISVIYPFLSSSLCRIAGTLSLRDCFQQHQVSRENAAGHVGKAIIRRAAKGLVPENVLARKTSSYGAPLMSWLAEEPFASTFQETILDSPIWGDVLFDQEYRNVIYNFIKRPDQCSGVDRIADILWVTYSISCWYNQWIS